jgi:hypothetical protein
MRRTQEASETGRGRAGGADRTRAAALYTFGKKFPTDAVYRRDDFGIVGVQPFSADRFAFNVVQDWLGATPACRVPGWAWGIASLGC